MVDVVGADAVARPGEPPDLRPGEVAVLDGVEREVELRDHPAGLERRQDLAHPGRRPVVEGQDHRPARQAGAVVPVRDEVARQDRRVAMRLEPIELRLERRGQRVVGEERALALRPPGAEVGRHGFDPVVVDDRHPAARDVQRRDRLGPLRRVGRRIEGRERRRRCRGGLRARTRGGPWRRRRGDDRDRAGIGGRRGHRGLAADQGDRDDGQDERHEVARAAVGGHGIPHVCVGRDERATVRGEVRASADSLPPAAADWNRKVAVPRARQT